MSLKINSLNENTVIESFRSIAKALFFDYKLKVNDAYYQLLEIEFYYYNENCFRDVYAHKHKYQLLNGKWYSHGSGLDITFGDGNNYGGILLRAIVKVGEEYPVEKPIFGPLKVKTEILSELHGVFDEKPNNFYLEKVSEIETSKKELEHKYIVETQRIGLTPEKDSDDNKYYNGKFRFIIYPNIGHKNKTQIAKDLQEQYLLSEGEVNKLMGSKFL